MTLAAEPLLLDDFRHTDGLAAIGTTWEGFTDRVMGGISNMEAGYTPGEGDGHHLRMQGEVRLENNGGFIQVRLPLTYDRAGFDASAYQGVAVTLRGTPGSYFLHVRCSNTRRVWQYFSAPLPVGEDWQRVVVPFSAFSARYMGQEPLNLDALRSIAIVAYGEAFSADVQVARVELEPL
ncbi:MAG: CIA30 family protein [Chromatiales bacterium]|nr:CIA30 family protein [Chromatiales bacterium]